MNACGESQRAEAPPVCRSNLGANSRFEEKFVTGLRERMLYRVLAPQRMLSPSHGPHATA